MLKESRDELHAIEVEAKKLAEARGDMVAREEKFKGMIGAYAARSDTNIRELLRRLEAQGVKVGRSTVYSWRP